MNAGLAWRDEALSIGPRVLLSFLSALLLTLCFPKFDLSLLAWFALIPLFIALKDKSLRASFALGILNGFTFWVGICFWFYWTPGVDWDDFILLGAYLGFYLGLFGLALNFVSQRTKLPSLFTAPFIWVAIEYLRSHAGFLGVPWGLLGHSQYLNLPLIQISSLTGVYGISFLIVMVNATLSEAIVSWISKKQGILLQHRRRILSGTVVSTGLVGISLAYGIVVLSKEPGQDRISVAVIQGNIPQEIRWEREYLKRNLERHIALTREAANSGHTSLIVWPETSVQGSLTQDLSLLNTMSTLALETQTHLLVGSAVRPKFGSREFRRRNWFNSAFLISPRGRILKKYDKINLLPFAEYLPYKDTFPWPEGLAAKAGHFIPGKEYTIFNVNGTNFGVMICWESIFPDIFRKFVGKGANFMVNITNEAWFGKTAAPYQFLAMNVFRAVENRVSIARSANTGVSGFIDPYGRILGEVKDGNKDIFVQGYLTMEIPLSQERTFYALYGDIFAYIILGLSIVMLAEAVLKARTA